MRHRVAPAPCGPRLWGSPTLTRWLWRLCAARMLHLCPPAHLEECKCGSVFRKRVAKHEGKAIAGVLVTLQAVHTFDVVDLVCGNDRCRMTYCGDGDKIHLQTHRTAFTWAVSASGASPTPAPPRTTTVVYRPARQACWHCDDDECAWATGHAPTHVHRHNREVVCIGCFRPHTTVATVSGPG